VDFPASSPFATGIGGTSLALNPDNSIRFQTGWGNNLTRIAETGGALERARRSAAPLRISVLARVAGRA